MAAAMVGAGVVVQSLAEGWGTLAMLVGNALAPLLEAALAVQHLRATAQTVTSQEMEAIWAQARPGIDPATARAQVPPVVSAPRPYSDAFWKTLATLASHGVSDDHAALALTFWHRASAGQPAEPHITLLEDGAVEFQWNNAQSAMTVGVHADGRFEWWTYDRVADRTEGSDDDFPSELPDAAWAFLARFPRP